MHGARVVADEQIRGVNEGRHLEERGRPRDVQDGPGGQRSGQLPYRVSLFLRPDQDQSISIGLKPFGQLDEAIKRPELRGMRGPDVQANDPAFARQCGLNRLLRLLHLARLQRELHAQILPRFAQEPYHFQEKWPVMALPQLRFGQGPIKDPRAPHEIRVDPDLVARPGPGGEPEFEQVPLRQPAVMKAHIEIAGPLPSESRGPFQSLPEAARPRRFQVQIE